MESFESLIKELNETESEYQIVHKQYAELKSIILHDNTLKGLDAGGSSEESSPLHKTSKTAKNEILLKNKSISKATDDNKKCNINKLQSTEQEDTNYKKLVKNRIKHFHTVMGNINNFKTDNRAKNKFLNNLALSNEDVLLKEKDVPSVQNFLNLFHM